jgi:hypothetical protein
MDYLCDFDNCNKIKELFKSEITKEEEKRRQEYYSNNQFEIEKYSSK